jgi:hypothetical protein
MIVLALVAGSQAIRSQLSAEKLASALARATDAEKKGH